MKGAFQCICRGEIALDSDRDRAEDPPRKRCIVVWNPCMLDSPACRGSLGVGVSHLMPTVLGGRFTRNLLSESWKCRVTSEKARGTFCNTRMRGQGLAGYRRARSASKVPVLKGAPLAVWPYNTHLAVCCVCETMRRSAQQP
jgi:hypothetical protein